MVLFGHTGDTVVVQGGLVTKTVLLASIVVSTRVTPTVPVVRVLV